MAGASFDKKDKREHNTISRRPRNKDKNRLETPNTYQTSSLDCKEYKSMGYTNNTVGYGGFRECSESHIAPTSWNRPQELGRITTRLLVQLEQQQAQILPKPEQTKESVPSFPSQATDNTTRQLGGVGSIASNVVQRTGGTNTENRFRRHLL